MHDPVQEDSVRVAGRQIKAFVTDSSGASSSGVGMDPCFRPLPLDAEMAEEGTWHLVEDMGNPEGITKALHAWMTTQQQQAEENQSPTILGKAKAVFARSPHADAHPNQPGIKGHGGTRWEGPSWGWQRWP